MSRVEVLISAMNQSDTGIIKKTNIRTDAVLINQCDRESNIIHNQGDNSFKIINTCERGLSNSRNMAIDNANDEFCLLCDDDEVLYDNYSDSIIKAFDSNKNADIICFIIDRENREYPNHSMKIGFLRSLKISSVQIAFRLEKIKEKSIKFDNRFGSGTEIASGEENIFMFDCLKNKLKIHYVPVSIGKIEPGQSNWFHGYNENYFINRGKIIRRLFGLPLGLLYCIYFSATKKNMYKSEGIKAVLALKLLIEGLLMKR